MKIEIASGKQPPSAKIVIPITESGIEKVFPEIQNKILKVI